MRRYLTIGVSILAMWVGGVFASTPDDETIGIMNRAVGMMEQYRFNDAAEGFRQVVERAPDWATARVNLGIAYLNSVSDPAKGVDSLELAAQSFRQAVELDPLMPHPYYCLGLLARYKGDSDAAIEQFNRVLELDPQSADALYFLGAVYMTKGDAPRAIELFRRAIDANPYLLSAHYSLAQALIRAGKRDEAMMELETFKQLDAAKVGVKRAIVYTEMGEYADVIRVFPAASQYVSPEPILIRYTPSTLLAESNDQQLQYWLHATNLPLGDVDEDGDLDVFISANRTRKSLSEYWFSNEHGVLTRFTGITTGAKGDGISSGSMTSSGGVFGDANNDGSVDFISLSNGSTELYFGKNPNVLLDDEFKRFDTWRERRNGVAWVDADHDSDLDLLLWSDMGLAESGVELYRNDSNRHFIDITHDSRLGAIKGNVRTTAIADFDNDGDVDFLFATESGCRLMSNDRLNRWSDVTAQSGLHNGADTTHLLTNDFDGDGDQDVVALRGLTTPARYYANQGDGTFKPYEWQIGLTATTGTTLDYDNDGDTDLFFPHASIQGGDQRAVLLSNDGMGKFRDASDETGIGSLSIPNFGASVGADLDDDGDTDILVARDGEPPLFLRNDGGNANRWLHITLEGAMANRSGYGAKVEVKAGSHWQKVDYQMVGGGLHATNPRLEFGLGQHETVDFVRILWNNGVLQSELEVPTNQHLVIKEVQRKASSCPILFSWNGERYVFVTDFLGVGGLGFFVAPGVTGAPDPTERVMLERHEIAPKDGEYIFQIMEPMEEIAYLDAARLIAVDHPIGTEVYPDERLALDGNMPTEAVYSYAERRYPIRATDQDGDDALELITKRDRLYPTLKRDPRFLGYLDGNHFLELDFGDLIPSDNRWILNVYGWIEYPYSHIVYGAYQAGIEGYGISIDAKAADGSWVEAMPSVGYPAGMPKNMTIDVTALIREGHTSLRLRTNQEIYYDDIWLSKDVSGSTLRLTTMPPSRATLQHTGYPREYSPDGRLPRLYDYMSLDKTYAFKNMNGAYTRFGDVRELLVAPDDRHVIMGRGEELTLVFDAAGLPPLPAGYTRSFLLDTHGYSKDMDLYTSFPDTVGPLPFRAMSGYPYSPEESYPDTPATRDYQERYQTRRK